MSFQQSSKDIKNVIAKFLDDRDILNFYILDRQQYNNVCDEHFFHNILLQRYPDTLKYINSSSLKTNGERNYYKNITFRKWYLKMVYYIDLLNKKYNFNYKTYNKGNPKNQYAIFKSLKGKNNRWELLLSASKKGELSLLKLAIEKGAVMQGDDDLPLREASLHGHLEIVKYLVEHGADIHANNSQALVWASASGYLEIVKYLLEHGADIHATDDNALRVASCQGSLETVKYLVEHGANIHAKNDQALRLASESGHLEIVKYLNEQQK